MILVIRTALILAFGTWCAGAWDYEGHEAINDLALAALPADFGLEMTPDRKARVEYLAGEPDRWRNLRDLSLRQANAPDHYVDLEDLGLLGYTTETLPPLRYDFMAQLARVRLEHPERFPAIDPTHDADHTRELYGFLPWSITENFEKLKSDFSILKTFRQEGGNEVEVANAEADCLYVMGILGHFVGDGSQPLHTSRNFNGWVGDNPEGYTTRTTFHAWIDGGYFRKTGRIPVEEMAGRIHQARRLEGDDQPDGVFRKVMDYLVASNQGVKPLYQMEKDGELSGYGEKGHEGLIFLQGQLIQAGQMLGDLWWTAWEDAGTDRYLQRQLNQRAASSGTTGP